jgi:hypothetical protein
MPHGFLIIPPAQTLEGDERFLIVKNTLHFASLRQPRSIIFGKEA